jgi:hypothetical protein
MINPIADIEQRERSAARNFLAAFAIALLMLPVLFVLLVITE